MARQAWQPDGTEEHIWTPSKKKPFQKKTLPVTTWSHC